MGKNIISEEEAREKLQRLVEASSYTGHGEPSIGQLISSAAHIVSPESVVPWCPICDRPQGNCICDDEEAKKRERERQMKSEREKAREAKAALKALREQLSEEDLKEIKEARKRDEGRDPCPICDSMRVEELIYSTGDRIIGCKLCLDRPEEVVQGDA